MSRHQPGRGPLAPWYTTLAPTNLGGSLYAVGATDRVAAARLLHESGCAVHIDLILDSSGASVGVELEEVAAVRAALPAARIDIHLIVLTENYTTAIRLTISEILHDAAAIGATWVTAADEIRAACAEEFAVLRSQNIAIWTEIAPDDDRSRVEDADGALVMFIRPGSSDRADPSILEKIPVLAQRTLVGVDGGITADLARACADAGATYIVSGRALLRGPTDVPPVATRTHPTATITKEHHS
ncbi:hypothetical protein HRK28_19225 [Rathayibacter sp. VKM Ac-2835]|uniref:hypothetical protein n=1 Tax=Rathayibacter sp. VKM Ac-2835 TaxID=2739043 RepID=UPI001566A74F|nr:hypothetical protein [Rathayibacter sp. VKM Ac-2835]